MHIKGEAQCPSEKNCSETIYVNVNVDDDVGVKL